MSVHAKVVSLFLGTGATVLLAIALGTSITSAGQEVRSAPSQAPGAPTTARGPVPIPPLFFKEEWKQPPYTGTLNDAARRLTQDAVTNANLELKVYGGCKDLLVYGTPNSIFPLNLWTGMCGPVAVTLRDKDNYVDLTGSARIRWNTRSASLHAVRPVLKLADGTLVVGSHADASPPAAGQSEPEMTVSEFSIAPIRWYTLDPDKIATMKPVDNPDLSKVEEVGFVDLMPGGGHRSAGWINVGQFEVYGKAVKR